jgi:hypothetical protein
MLLHVAHLIGHMPLLCHAQEQRVQPLEYVPETPLQNREKEKEKVALIKRERDSSDI